MQLLEKSLQPGDRTYTIAIPEGMENGDVPLILGLHFAGHGVSKPFMLGLMEPALRDSNALLAAPDCTGASWTDPQSEKDLLDLLEHLIGTHSVDPERVLLMGYSMGGIGTWHIASRHPKHFAGAIIMAGRPPDDAQLIDWQIPLYVVHSRADHLMPLDLTEAAVESLRARGKSVEFVVLDQIPHFETHLFVPALRAAIPWIHRTWAKTPPGDMQEH